MSTDTQKYRCLAKTNAYEKGEIYDLTRSEVDALNANEQAPRFVPVDETVPPADPAPEATPEPTPETPAPETTPATDPAAAPSTETPPADPAAAAPVDTSTEPTPPTA